MTGPALAAADLTTLVDVCEHALRLALEEGRRWAPDVARFSLALQAPGAAFVTVRRDGHLLGCIGTMERVEPLVRVVADRTLAAAFSDPRTRGVAAADWVTLDLEVSVLSELVPFGVDSYAELVEHVAANVVTGFLVESDRCRATFLPSVREQVPDAAEFVDALWHKAGLRRGAWPSGLSLASYTVIKIVGSPPRAPLHSRPCPTPARCWSN